MAILVEEGLHPNGIDLVVKDARLNPVAQANAVPQKQVEVRLIGDGFAVTGCSLQLVPMEGEMRVAVVIHGCKPSQLVPVTKLAGVVVGFVGKIELEALKKNLAQGLGETWEPPAKEPVA